MPVETLVWVGDRPGHVRMIEQTLLPTKFEELDVRDVAGMVDAIYRLAVRGAPAIGVAAAFGVLLGVQDSKGLSGKDMLGQTKEVAATLANARPTAVNLFWALERMVAHAQKQFDAGADGDAIVTALFEEAHLIFKEDQTTCEALGRHGAELITDGGTYLTHCNAGALATANTGTALAPFYEAQRQGKTIAVFADETRPLLQGARLTTWELMQAGIDVTLITDSMAGRVMFEGKIDAVFVGSDRIARNGDVCNKIGTYSVAVLAKEHNVPFYAVAPLSTFDRTITNGDQIPIEERDPKEITCGFGSQTAPDGVKTYNPAFDVTPARLVTGIITEAGLIEHPTQEKVEAVMRKAGIELA
ncbi:MAG: methylthioribose-1-phosphate isomerase [Planctomycetota bacterium]|jgi:methylthioribose-1-phosphate isomerase